ncbi:MAG: DUF2085 domain-containing protein [Chloroflexota bacterium]
MATPPKQPVTGRQRTIAIRLQKLTYRFARHWLFIFNLFFLAYAGLPALAPVLMHAGLTTPARLIYTIYSPMCHQMASRSYFLFGEQIAYPRALAGTDLTPIESYMSSIPEFSAASTDPANWGQFLFAARQFIGNGQMGYKTAVCERDLAIYGFVFIGGLVYGAVRQRRKVGPLPLLAFILIGMGPIGLDGFSQLFSQFASTPAFTSLQAIFPLRESTPFLRTFTGAIFGFMLVWLTFPHINEGLKETEEQLAIKLRRIGELPEEL